MTMQTQEQSPRTQPVPGTNGAHPVEDGLARPAGFPTPEAASARAELAPAPAGVDPPDLFVVQSRWAAEELTAHG